MMVAVGRGKDKEPGQNTGHDTIGSSADLWPSRFAVSTRRPALDLSLEHSRGRQDGREVRPVTAIIATTSIVGEYQPARAL